eukprot:710676-Prymnesium_polylepis.1
MRDETALVKAPSGRFPGPVQVRHKRLPLAGCEATQVGATLSETAKRSNEISCRGDRRAIVGGETPL